MVNLTFSSRPPHPKVGPRDRSRRRTFFDFFFPDPAGVGGGSGVGGREGK
jgi:hypothetical protein